MTVYVDNQRNSFGRMIMCHMVANTPLELHDMAAKIGLKREWFQDGGSIPHYDLSLEKRAAAIRCGAKEISARELVALIRSGKS